MKFFDEAEGEEFSKVVSFATVDSAGILNEVYAYSKDKANVVLADYGGGTGDLLKAAQKHLKSKGISTEAYNIDVDDTKFTHENQEGYYDVKADLFEMPFKSGFFDAGLSRLVFQYIGPYDMQKRVLQEIYRTLKPGAEFYLQVMYAPDEETKSQLNDLFKGLESLLISAGKMARPLNTEVLTTKGFHTILAEVGFREHKVLRKVDIPQSTDELRNRFKLSLADYQKMGLLFSSTKSELFGHLKVTEGKSGPVYVLPTILIRAIK